MGKFDCAIDQLKDITYLGKFDLTLEDLNKGLNGVSKSSGRSFPSILEEFPEMIDFARSTVEETDQKFPYAGLTFNEKRERIVHRICGRAKSIIFREAAPYLALYSLYK